MKTTPWGVHSRVWIISQSLAFVRNVPENSRHQRGCHLERSERSLLASTFVALVGVLRFAQDDSVSLCHELTGRHTRLTDNWNLRRGIFRQNPPDARIVGHLNRALVGTEAALDIETQRGRTVQCASVQPDA